MGAPHDSSLLDFLYRLCHLRTPEIYLSEVFVVFQAKGELILKHPLRVNKSLYIHRSSIIMILHIRSAYSLYQIIHRQVPIECAVQGWSLRSHVSTTTNSFRCILECSIDRF